MDSYQMSISILEPVCPGSTITTHRVPNIYFLHAKWASGADVLSEARILFVHATAEVEIRFGGIGATRCLSQGQNVAGRGSLAIVGDRLTDSQNTNWERMVNPHLDGYTKTLNHRKILQ